MVSDFYKRMWTWLRSKFLRLFLVSLSLFFGAALISHFYFSAHPGLASKAFARLAEILAQRISPDATGFELFLQILLNNLRAGTLFLLLGFVPFLFIPAFGICINGIQIGLVSSVTIIEGKSLFKVLIFGILPHGIFEIPAILLANTLGLYISIQILKKIMDFDKEKIPFLETVKKTAAAWAVVVIPLIIVGALIEAFLTPILINTFI